MGIPDEAFEDVLEEFKKKAGAKQDTDLTADQLKELVEAFKKVFKKETKQEFPQNPLQQMKLATEAVFRILEW